MKQVGASARLLALFAIFVIGALGVAGCGDDKDENGGSGGTQTAADGSKKFSNDDALGKEKKVEVDSKASFDEEQQAVLATIAAFGDATANKDYKSLCRKILSKDAAKIGGNCEKTFSETGEALDDFKVTVKSVKVGDGGKSAIAEVSVKSNVAPEAQTQQLSLVKEGGEWRIQILGQ